MGGGAWKHLFARKVFTVFVVVLSLGCFQSLLRRFEEVQSVLPQRPAAKLHQSRTSCTLLTLQPHSRSRTLPPSQLPLSTDTTYPPPTTTTYLSVTSSARNQESSACTASSTNHHQIPAEQPLLSALAVAVQKTDFARLSGIPASVSLENNYTLQGDSASSNVAIPERDFPSLAQNQRRRWRTTTSLPRASQRELRSRRDGEDQESGDRSPHRDAVTIR